MSTGDRDVQMGLGELVASGRSGLRVGNAAVLAQAAREGGITPDARKILLMSEEEEEDDATRSGSSNVALKACVSRILGTFDASSLVHDVIQDLFPMSQAVHESAPMSACLRFSVEYARMRMYESIHYSVRDVSLEMQRQEPVVQRWKRRCESQLDLIGVCSSNGVFEMIPPSEQKVDCPFRISDAYDSASYYITPGCVVYIAAGISTQEGLRGAFYNPCRLSSDPCSSAGGAPLVSLSNLLLESSSTRVPFDPRSTGKRDALGTWPLNFRGLDEEGQSRQNDVARAAEEWSAGGSDDEVPFRLTREFVEKVVRTGGEDSQGSLGNTRQAWSKAEGFNQTEFCDGIADWWPEDWTMPAGYHVTLPCNKDQAGYRTFDAAFAVERPGDKLYVVMR